jgi:2-(1,2-epoxy-1,2-dihydrophenyl)acetyl-CoA isomerase
MFKKIIFEREDGIGVLRLNRPEVMNAFDPEMLEELLKAIDQIQHDDHAKVLLITGTGKAFCVGVDITTVKGLSIERGTDFLKKAQQVVLNLVAMEKPVIAAVHGYAFGGGWNLALACDLVIASEDAKFSQAFVKIGLVSDMGGMYFLPKWAGLNKAKELMFTGETIDAREAERIGMVNRIVPRDDLEGAAKELAQKIALGPSKPIALMKRILSRAASLDLSSLFELETQAQALCFQTEDHKKSVEAFLQRRK